MLCVVFQDLTPTLAMLLHDEYEQLIGLNL